MWLASQLADTSGVITLNCNGLLTAFTVKDKAKTWFSRAASVRDCCPRDRGQRGETYLSNVASLVGHATISQERRGHLREAIDCRKAPESSA